MCDWWNGVRLYIGMLFLGLTLILCLVGLVAPNWAFYEYGVHRPELLATTTVPPTTTSMTTMSWWKHDEHKPLPSPKYCTGVPTVEGLWVRCEMANYTTCTWFWQDGFEISASAPVFVVGFVLHIFAFLLASGRACGWCNCTEKVPEIVACIVLLAFCAIIMPPMLFGSSAYSTKCVIPPGVHVRSSSSSIVPSTTPRSSLQPTSSIVEAHGTVGWACLVSIAATVMSFISMIFFGTRCTMQSNAPVKAAAAQELMSGQGGDNKNVDEEANGKLEDAMV